MRNNKSNNISKLYNKNKYNLVLLVIVLLISIFLFSKLASYISNKSLSNYDNEIVVVKNNDSEIDSLSLKDIRKMGKNEMKFTTPKGEEFKLVGVSIEKILNKEGINPNLNNTVEFSDGYGHTTNMSMETALEVNRVLLVYKINNKANMDYDKKLGIFFIVDKQEKDSSKWIKNIQSINIK